MADLSVARGDIVMFADADTGDFGEHFVYGTLGPLLLDRRVQFSKAAYRRPYTTGGHPSLTAAAGSPS